MAAALPVSTKIPAPMMQRMPRPMSENGPSVFGRPPSALAAMASRDFRPVYCAIDMRLPLCFGILDFRRWAVPRQSRQSDPEQVESGNLGEMADVLGVG